MVDRADVDKLTKQLADRGKIIAAGWLGFRLVVINKDASQCQLDEMCMAFYAGAQHLFGSIMSTMDAGEEPTDADMKRLDFIRDELEEFLVQFKKKHNLKDLPDA